MYGYIYGVNHFFYINLRFKLSNVINNTQTLA